VTGAAGASATGGGPVLADLPADLGERYLDAALTVLRVGDPSVLPNALRGFSAWAPRRLHSPRVVGLVRRALESEPAFRTATDEYVLAAEPQLAELLRAGRHAEALASGEPPATVAMVGLAMGEAGAAAVTAATQQAQVARAQAVAARSAAATAEVAAERAAAQAKADQEAAAAKAAREQARQAADELRRSERERRRLEARVAELETALREARAATSAAEAKAGAERRRLSARLAEQRAAAEELARANRALRRPGGVDPALTEAVGALERDLAALRRAAGVEAAAQAAAGQPAPARPERRQPMPVPGGRTADDPETLFAWAGTPGVLVLVDGYNVTKHPLGFGDRSLEDQRTVLVARCRRLARRSGELVIVFDGAEVGPLPPSRMAVNGVGVVFTDAGRTADDEIVARVNAEPPERPVVVVSSDNEVRERSAALGANTVRAQALLGLGHAR
jgi:predicted RNA-binding protein with PIN domain